MIPKRYEYIHVYVYIYTYIHIYIYMYVYLFRQIEIWMMQKGYEHVRLCGHDLFICDMTYLHGTWIIRMWLDSLMCDMTR